MNNQDIIDSMDLEEFVSYPTIELESLNEFEISNINNIVNDPNLSDYDYVPGNYVRIYTRGREPNVDIFEIKKCLRYIGTINTAQQFYPPETQQLHNQVTPMTIDTIDSPIYEPYTPDTPSISPPETPPPLSVTTIESDSPNSISSTGTLIGGKKKKSRKVKNKKKNKSKKKTRKGGKRKKN